MLGLQDIGPVPSLSLSPPPPVSAAGDRSSPLVVRHSKAEASTSYSTGVLLDTSPCHPQTLLSPHPSRMRAAFLWAGPLCETVTKILCNVFAGRRESRAWLSSNHMGCQPCLHREGAKTDDPVAWGPGLKT